MDVTSRASSVGTGATTKSPAKSPAQSAPASAAQKGVAANALTGDFNTFVKLLTAQMTNQDPLEPTSNTEFVSQLASFSAVEQQIQTNNMLSTMLEQMGLGGSGGAGGWIGKEVLVPGGYADFSGDPVDVEVEPIADVDKAVLLVKDEKGETVARQTVDPATTSVTWDGRDETGNTVPSGLYSFQVQGYVNDIAVETQDASVFSAVSEVRLSETGTQLIVAGDVSVAVEDVAAIR